MFTSQLEKFSSVFGTSKDKRNQETNLSLAYQSSAPRKLVKYDLTWHLLSGRKSPYLLQLMVAAQSNFNIITDSSGNLTKLRMKINN